MKIMDRSRYSFGRSAYNSHKVQSHERAGVRARGAAAAARTQSTFVPRPAATVVFPRRAALVIEGKRARTAESGGGGRHHPATQPHTAASAAATPGRGSIRSSSAAKSSG